MDFIIDNYLWFGILGVVLLMALIGFLAEKTNFIKADNTSKSEKKKKGKKADVSPQTPAEGNNQPAVNTVAPTTVDTPPVASSVATVETKEVPVQPQPTTPKKETEVLHVDSVTTEKGEDLTQPFGDKTVKTPVQKTHKKTVTETEDEDIWKF